MGGRWRNTRIGERKKKRVRFGCVRVFRVWFGYVNKGKSFVILVEWGGGRWSRSWRTKGVL